MRLSLTTRSSSSGIPPALLAGLLLAATLSSAAAAAAAATTTLTLFLPSDPIPATLSPRTHATLSSHGQRLSAPLTDAHAFVFRNVSPGSYLADVHCPTDGFMPVRIDVDFDGHGGGGGGRVRAWDTYRGNDWDNKGEELPLLRRDGGEGEGFEVRALGRKGYFMERPTFSILSILMNPMILMGLVSMLIFIGMPKLVENMDPETRAEWEASQKDNPMNALLGGVTGGGGGGGGGGNGKSHQATNPLGNFDMAAYLAGSNKKETSTTTSGGGGGGGGSAAAVAEVESRARSQGVRR